MFGDLLITLRLPQPARKGGAHRANDPGDGNNVWVGKIRSQVLPPSGATDAVHRLEGSGLPRELKIKSNPPETGWREESASHSESFRAHGPGAALVAGSCRSFPQDSSVEFSFMR